MSFSSQEETYDSDTPSSSSSRTSIDGFVLHYRSSKETIQTYQGSISNSSAHTNTAVIHEDLFGFSEQGPLPSVSHHSSDLTNTRLSLIGDGKSLYSLEKQTSGSRNQSQSTVCTIPEPESNGGATATSTQGHEFRSLNRSSVEDEDESFHPSTARYSRDIASTLTTDLCPSSIYAVPHSPPLDDGDSQPLATGTTPGRPFRPNIGILNDLHTAGVSRYVDPYDNFILTVSALVCGPSGRSPPKNSHSSVHPPPECSPISTTGIVSHCPISISVCTA